MTARGGGPREAAYDTVIVGGAVMGSSLAYWLSENPDYDGTVLVVEMDSTYERASTTLSEASVRHQFSEPVNIRLSMFATEFIAEFHERVQVAGESPDLGFRDTGYLFLATDDGMDVLRENHEAQRSCGAEVALLSPGELAERFGYMHVDDLAGASLGLRNEGTLDAYSLMRGSTGSGRSTRSAIQRALGPVQLTTRSQATMAPEAISTWVTRSRVGLVRSPTTRSVAYSTPLWRARCWKPRINE